jgi:hypothetical protein
MLLQAIVNVPAASPTDALSEPADPARLSLVIAETVSETDPQKLCARPDCTSLYRGHYKDAVVLAGPTLDPQFSARVEMGSPWNRPYRLAMIVEQREGGLLVRALAGFDERTGEACFDARDTEKLNWRPEGAGIVKRHRMICVRVEAN